MHDPKALISTAELARALGQPQVRIYDCTTFLEPTPLGSEDPYIAVAGIGTFQEAHIPGADFLDLQGEFSDAGTGLRFMMPATAQLEAAFGRHGIGKGTRVVLYSIGSMMWATRFWWMLRSLGFEDAAVLDGGLDRWKAEARPVESGPAKGYPRATFAASPRPGFFVDKAGVAAALGERGTVIVNALGPQFHKGLEPSRYGRPGRIPGSVNVPAATLVETGTRSFISLADAAGKFEAEGVAKGKRVVCYCGGGISATIDLFVLYQLGYDNLTLYDGSMGEWAKDRELPIETDRQGMSGQPLPAPLVEAIARLHAAMGRVANGDVSPIKALYAHTSDATSFYGWGGHETGWDAVSQRWDWAGRQFKGGTVSYRNLTTVATAELAYTTDIETFHVRMDGLEQPVQWSNRVTHIFRLEDQWRLVHRHANRLEARYEPSTRAAVRQEQS